jgi:hypothetical protein
MTTIKKSERCKRMSELRAEMRAALSPEGKTFAKDFYEFYSKNQSSGYFILYNFLIHDTRLLLYFVDSKPKTYSSNFLCAVKSVIYLYRDKNPFWYTILPQYLKIKIGKITNQYSRTNLEIRKQISKEEHKNLRDIGIEWFKENYYKEIPAEILKKIEK